MFDNEKFQKRLKQLREEDSIHKTQKDFSEFLGIGQQTLSAYEKGISKPPIDVICNIAEKCNVSVDWLCGQSNAHRSADHLLTYSDVIEHLGFLTTIPELKASVCAQYNSQYMNCLPYCEVQLQCDELLTFFNDWNSLLDLYRQGTIKEDLYNMWITSKLAEYDFPFKEPEPPKKQKAAEKIEKVELSDDEDLPF